MIANIKKFFKENEADIILVIGVILISLISFGGGWLLGNSSKLTESSEIKIEEVSPKELQASPTKLEKEKSNKQRETSTQPQTEEQKTPLQEEQKESDTTGQKKFVASKNGSVYHYPWYPGAQQIKEENKIYFNSKEEAEKAGYRPAKNCPGL